MATAKNNSAPDDFEAVVAAPDPALEAEARNRALAGGANAFGVSIAKVDPTQDLTQAMAQLAEQEVNQALAANGGSPAAIPDTLLFLQNLEGEAQAAATALFKNVETKSRGEIGPDGRVASNEIVVQQPAQSLDQYVSSLSAADQSSMLSTVQGISADAANAPDLKAAIEAIANTGSVDDLQNLGKVMRDNGASINITASGVEVSQETPLQDYLEAQDQELVGALLEGLGQGKKKAPQQAQPAAASDPTPQQPAQQPTQQQAPAAQPLAAAESEKKPKFRSEVDMYNGWMESAKRRDGQTGEKLGAAIGIAAVATGIVLTGGVLGVATLAGGIAVGSLAAFGSAKGIQKITEKISGGSEGIEAIAEDLAGRNLSPREMQQELSALGAHVGRKVGKRVEEFQEEAKNDPVDLDATRAARRIVFADEQIQKNSNFASNAVEGMGTRSGAFWGAAASVTAMAVTAVATGGVGVVAMGIAGALTGLVGAKAVGAAEGMWHGSGKAQDEMKEMNEKYIREATNPELVIEKLNDIGAGVPGAVMRDAKFVARDEATTRQEEAVLNPSSVVSANAAGASQQPQQSQTAAPSAVPASVQNAQTPASVNFGDISDLRMAVGQGRGQAQA